MSARQALHCFKAYDVRGQLGKTLDAGIAFAIGQGVAVAREAKIVVVGRDARESSATLSAALVEGLTQAGVQVFDLELCGTEEVYFATDYLGADAGLCITASHNPIDYNGIKLVGTGATPFSPTDLDEIRMEAEAALAAPVKVEEQGSITIVDTRAAYIKRVLSFVDPAAMKPLKVLVNAGNGAAGPTFDAIAVALKEAGAPVKWVRMHHDPDPNFPNGIPNPLLEENQPVTGNAVVAHGCDLGLAWDGDFDRCFFFDGNGRFVPGEYMVGLLAAAFLEINPGAKIVHDPRVCWNTIDIVKAMGGRSVASRTGHAFMKAKMRETNAIYGGEMSAHHYFRDFMYCDSGMIPALLVIAHMSSTERSLADLVAARRTAFPSSGEINFRIEDGLAAIDAVKEHYKDVPHLYSDLDGISMEFGDWRMNLRRSNTEPLVRLNLETRERPDLLQAKTRKITALLSRFERGAGG